MIRISVFLMVVFGSLLFLPSTRAIGECDLNANLTRSPQGAEALSSDPNQLSENSVTAAPLAGCGGQTNPPTTPSSISAPSTSSSGSYTISWGASSGFTGLGKKYYLYESVSGGVYSQIANITYTSTSYAVSGKGDGSFQYAVEACNLDECSGWQTAGNTTTVRNKPLKPGAPNPTTTTDTNNVTVSWGSVSSATYYVI